MAEEGGVRARLSLAVRVGDPSSGYGLQGRALRSCYAYVAWVSFAALDPVARRQECVEALDQIGVASKKFRHALDDSRGIDAGTSC